MEIEMRKGKGKGKGKRQGKEEIVKRKAKKKKKKQFNQFIQITKSKSIIKNPFYYLKRIHNLLTMAMQ